MQKHINRRQYHLNRMNLNKVMSKSVKLDAILEPVAAILNFQMFTYLDLTNASKYFVCVNDHASVAIINYLGQINLWKRHFLPWWYWNLKLRLSLPASICFAVLCFDKLWKSNWNTKPLVKIRLNIIIYIYIYIYIYTHTLLLMIVCISRPLLCTW